MERLTNPIARLLRRGKNSGLEYRRAGDIEQYSLSYRFLKDNPEFYTEIENRLFFEAELSVGSNIRKQMTKMGLEYVDCNMRIEAQYSDWFIVVIGGKIAGIVMERRGKEHKNNRLFCNMTEEVAQMYLPMIPELLDYPDEIPLVLDARAFNVEKLNRLFNGRYEVDPTMSSGVHIRGYTDRANFSQAPMPDFNKLAKKFYSNRILDKQQNERTRRDMKQFSLRANPESSFKARSLKTGHYWEFFDFEHPPYSSDGRVALAGIISQVPAKGGMPVFGMSGDLGVRLDKRNEGLGYGVRWLSFNSYLIENPEGIIAVDYRQDNEGAKKIFMDYLKLIDVSESLWVMMKK